MAYIVEIKGKEMKCFKKATDAVKHFASIIENFEKNGFVNYGHGYLAKLVKDKEIVIIETYLG